MSRWIGLGALLLAPWYLSGCLWITATAAVIAASSGGGSSGAPAPAGVSVALMESEPAAVGGDACGDRSPGTDPGWREGVVHFQVTLSGDGEYPVELYYRDAEGETSIVASQITGEGAAGDPRHRHSLSSPGPHSFAWDSRAAVGDAKRIWIVARSRGASGSTADSFWVDNRPPGTVAIVTSPSPLEVHHDTVSIPLSLAGAGDVAVRLQVRGDDAGNARVEHLAPGTSYRLEGSTLRWDAHVDLPDDHALVRLEVAPANGIKRGDFVSTDCFYVDNRAPRILAVQPQAPPSDARFTLQVIGQGLRWRGGGTGASTQVSLTLPGVDAVHFEDPSSSSPAAPVKDLETRKGPSCPCSEDLGPDLLGPGLLDFSIGPDELAAFGLDGHVGPVTVHLRSPNGRVARLEGELFLGPSRLSPIGPYYLLEGTPRKVVLGDFAPDPAAGGGGSLSGFPGPAHLDAAVIFEDRNIVTILGGDGSGFFPDRWIVPLSTQGARPLAIVKVPAGAGGCDGLLVATETTLELIRCEPGRRGSFSTQVVAEDLASEPETRDLVLADFDGDGADDAAVSSRVRSVVQVFRGGRNGDEWFWWEAPEYELAVSLPVSVAAANFDADPLGLADLVVLGDREGVDTLFLHRNQGLWLTPEADAFLLLTDGAVSVFSRPDALFNKEDPYPDLIVVRKTGIGRLLTTYRADKDEWSLKRFPRPTGPTTESPTAAALIRLRAGLGRGSERLLDIVSVDHELLACAYASTDGVNAGVRSQYRLPGPGVAMDAGDVNGDGQDDAAIVSTNPSCFLVFLGRADCTRDEPGQCREDDDTVEGLQSDPFVLPAGRLDGENAAIFPNGEDLKVGRQGGAIFLATANRLSEEVIVVSLKPGTVDVDRLVRFRDFGLDLRALAVADFDGDGDDEIAVTARKETRITILDPRDGARKVVLELRALHADAPFSLPEDLRAVADTDAKQLRGLIKMTTGQLNGQGPPEILLGLITEAENGGLNRDYVVVVVDPGSESQAVHFYRTLDDPRQCTVANINGDEALDLVIACEGDGTPQGGGFPEPVGNSVHILFGDPQRSGGRFFFDEGSAPGDRPGWIAPLQLPAIPQPASGGETEFVLTDSLRENGFAPATFILASNSPQVIAYRLCRGTACDVDAACSLDGYPKAHPAGRETLFVAAPCPVLTGGGDPEELLLADLFPELPGLELVVADEDKNTVELFQSRGVGVGWEPRSTLEVGTPFGVAAVPTKGGRLALVVGSGSQRQIIFYQQACSPECFYTPTHTQPLLDPSVAGGLPGFSATPAPGHGVLTAALVEDRDLVSREAAVDVTLLPLGLARAALAFLGDPAGAAPSARIELAGDQEPDGILVVDLASPSGGVPDGFPDLLLHEPGGAVSILPLAAPADAGASPVGGVPVPIAGLALPGSLIDWEVLQTVDGRSLLIAASRMQVRAVDLLPVHAGARVDVTLPASPTLHQIAHGWRDPGRADVSRAFLVLLEDRDVQVSLLEPGTAPVSLFDSVGEVQNVLLRAVGAADINRDGLDDIVAVDALSSSLLVFLAVEAGPLAFEPSRAFPYPGQLEPVALAFLDANGDTVRDVAFGARDGTVLLFAGAGDGTFGGAEELFAGPELESVRAFDLDGDGKDEILAAVGVPGLVVLSTLESIRLPGGGQ